MNQKVEKQRADLLLVEQGLIQSREKAKALIMAGQVYVGTNRIDKAGELVPVTAQLEIKGQKLRYVSRGGLKLEKAMNTFPIDLTGLRMIDIGASTGGFTDCALQNGAREVIALDVGYGQLDWSLRNDPRVIVMEKTNARELSLEMIKEPVDFVSIDVSFISLSKIYPVLPGIFSEKGMGVSLIKPQFEAGREKVGKKGVVRDIETHKEVITNVLNYLKDAGLHPYGLTFSPIKGPEGNIEYLLWFGMKPDIEISITQEDISSITEQAFSGLNHKE